MRTYHLEGIEQCILYFIGAPGQKAFVMERHVLEWHRDALTSNAILNRGAAFDILYNFVELLGINDLFRIHVHIKNQRELSMAELAAMTQ